MDNRVRLGLRIPEQLHGRLARVKRERARRARRGQGSRTDLNAMAVEALRALCTVWERKLGLPPIDDPPKAATSSSPQATAST